MQVPRHDAEQAAALLPEVLAGALACREEKELGESEQGAMTGEAWVSFGPLLALAALLLCALAARSEARR